MENSELNHLLHCWTSKNPADFIQFYDEMDSMDALIKFISNLPKPEIHTKIINLNQNPKLVVIVPTSGHQNDRCKGIVEFFSPYPVVLVESNGPWFNYSVSCNAGISEALKLNPEWIIISNDDMIFKDNLPKLISEIDSNNTIDLLIPISLNSRYHGELIRIKKENIGTLLMDAWSYKRKGEWDSFRLAFRILSKTELRKNLVFEPYRSNRGLAKFISRKAIMSFHNFADFGIFRKNVLETLKFDEKYQNGWEDYDFMVNYLASGKKYRLINFQIKQVGGLSLSTDGMRKTRLVREYFNRSYFYFKNKSCIKRLKYSKIPS